MLKCAINAVLVVFVVLSAGQASAASLDRQRTLFVKAEQAIARGDQTAFQHLSSRLRDYPLLPYLEYQALRKRLKQAGSREVSAFLKTHEDTPLASRLRNNNIRSA